MRVGIIVIVAGLALLALSALSAGAGADGISIAFGAIGLNALIVGPFFLLRPFADRLRRYLPPWLPW